MNLIRLLETSTFRLALIYLALFGVSALALLGFLYFRTAVVMEQQTEETIDATLNGNGQLRVATQPRLAGGERSRRVATSVVLGFSLSVS